MGIQKKLDGKSLRPLLEEGDAAGQFHDCLYYWREKTLYAIRCGAFKAHFFTRSGFNTSDPPLEHDPPLLYNIEWDAGEAVPLNTMKYHKELLLLQKEADKHVDEIYNDKPPSLYPQQDFSIMPCCPRGALGTPVKTYSASYSNLSLDASKIPDFWEKCVCTRPTYHQS